jgi:hypothetical protein
VIRATVDFTGSHLERITAVLPEVCSDRPPMTMPTSGRAIGAPGTRPVARMTAELEELICHRSRNCIARRVGPPVQISVELALVLAATLSTTVVFSFECANPDILLFMAALRAGLLAEYRMELRVIGY